MVLLQKFYKKILLFFSCGLIGVSTFPKQTYAAVKSTSRMVEMVGKQNAYSPLRYSNRYLIHGLSISYIGPVWLSKRGYLSGYCRSGHNYSRVTCFSIPFASSSLQRAYHSPFPQRKKMGSTVFSQKLNFAMAPAKEHFFVGCTKEIAILSPYFDKKGEFVIFPPITGFGGIGKTQLVYQLIAQHASKYDHMVWIDATTEKSIDTSYLQIAKKLGIHRSSNKTAVQVSSLVQDRLKDMHVLYIFDNAPNLKTIQPYFQNGHILITSRNNATIDWKSSHYDTPVALGPFSEEEALQLAQKMGQDTTDPYLAELIQVLPKYPLAMMQLLSDMCACKYTPEIFLHKVQQNTELINQLKENPQEYTTYQSSLFDMIASTLETLQSRASGKALLYLLQQLAYLNVQPIPLSFVLLALGKEEEKSNTRSILLTLERHGFIKWDEQNVYMHDLIQTIIGNNGFVASIINIKMVYVLKI